MSVILDKETEQVTTTVNFLGDIDVEWISLVDHGANRAPFKLIKSEGCVENIIQSIVIPRYLSFDDLKVTNPGLDKVEVKKVEEYDSYRKHISLGQAAFVENTLHLVKLKNDAYVFVGALKNPDPAAVLYKCGEVVIEMPEGDGGGDTSGGPNFSGGDPGQQDQGIGHAIKEEVDSMMAVVSGVLGQSTIDMKKKKAAISNSIDAFKAYLMATLDVFASTSDPTMGNAIIKMDISKPEINSEVIVDTKQEIQKNESAAVTPVEIPVVEKPIDLTAILGQLASIATQNAAVLQKFDEILLAKREESIPAIPVADPLVKMQEDMAALLKKVEELEAADTEVPVAKAQNTVVKDSPELVEKVEEKGIFAGVFFGK
jgi:hypothetical protein